MKTYGQFITEISGKLVGSYLQRAGQAIKSMVSSPEKQKLLPKITKRSGGIKAAKARPMPFYTGGFVLSHKQKFILDQYKDKLSEIIKHDNSITRNPSYASPEGLIAGFARHDPSGKHEDYLNYMVRMYVNKNFRVEDLPRIEDELRKFDKLKPQLPNKDINSYKDLNQLYDAIDSVEPKLSKNASMELVKKAGTLVLVDKPDFKLLKLKNYGAVKQYCSGTRWCFTTDYDTFKDYSGGLYLILARIGGEIRKFAFHSGSNQFMNERDYNIIDGVYDGTPAAKKTVAELLKFPDFQKALNIYFGSGIDGQLQSKELARTVNSIKTQDKELEELYNKKLNIILSGKRDDDDVFDHIIYSYIAETKQPLIPKLEKSLFDYAIKIKDFGALAHYAIYLNKPLPPEIETKLIEYEGPGTVKDYFKIIPKGKSLPHAENILFNPSSHLYKFGNKETSILGLITTFMYLVDLAKKRAPEKFEPFLYRSLSRTERYYAGTATISELNDYRIKYAKKYLMKDERPLIKKWISIYKRWF